MAWHCESASRNGYTAYGERITDFNHYRSNVLEIRRKGLLTKWLRTRQAKSTSTLLIDNCYCKKIWGQHCVFASWVVHILCLLHQNVLYLPTVIHGEFELGSKLIWINMHETLVSIHCPMLCWRLLVVLAGGVSLGDNRYSFTTYDGECRIKSDGAATRHPVERLC